MPGTMTMKPMALGRLALLLVLGLLGFGGVNVVEGFRPGPTRRMPLPFSARVCKRLGEISPPAMDDLQLSVTSNPAVSSESVSGEMVVLHRYDRRRGICAEVTLPKIMARMAVRVAGMKHGGCENEGFTEFVEAKLHKNRFGEFEARFYTEA